MLYMWWSPDPLPHLAECRIAWSPDHGRTWTRADWAFTFEDGLTIPTFCSFGRDDAGARDEYVYSYFVRPRYGPGPSRDPRAYRSGFDVHRPGEVYLARTPRERILERPAYQFYAGSDSGAPRWSSSLGDKHPAFVDPNGVGWNLSVSYNPALRRYLLCTEHGWSHLGRLGIFDAPEPWGPWSTVAYLGAFGEGHVPVNTFFWSFPTKWLEPNGPGFTLLFTGRTENDSLNSVRGRFRLRQAADIAAAGARAERDAGW
jgi:hypothetical protein